VNNAIKRELSLNWNSY